LWHPQTTTSINSKDLYTEFDIYPLPCRNELVIEFMENEFIRKISVYDVNGKLTFNNIYSKKDSKLRLDVRDYDSGIYFVEIETAKNSYSRKFIKVK